MELVETWDNIWRGNGKDNGRLWTTFIPSHSSLGCVWVAAALLNPVWNFWLQSQHIYVFLFLFVFLAFSASIARKRVAASSQGRVYNYHSHRKPFFIHDNISLGCSQDIRTQPAVVWKTITIAAEICVHKWLKSEVEKLFLPPPFSSDTERLHNIFTLLRALCKSY